VHDLGEVEAEEHTAHGTRLRARVPQRLAGELAGFTVRGAPARSGDLAGEVKVEVEARAR